MELKKLMQSAGIVGAGGAGFPSYAKLAEGADTLLINGSECEPLLYTDLTVLAEEMDTVLDGIGVILGQTNISKAYLCIKEHTAKALSLNDGDTLADKTFVKVLPDVYPVGDEVGLIFEALGRVVRPGNLPISVGVIVYNAETVYNVAKAALYGETVTEKWLTVGGFTDIHAVVRAPIGAKISELFDKLGIRVPTDCEVLDGGPSMGKIINYRTATVTKTTKALLVLPRTARAVEAKRINQSAAVSRAETACCQCTRCTDMCPRHLLGYPLEPHKMVRTAMSVGKANPMTVLSATLCCGCGICESLACNQGISPKAVINSYKALLGEKRLRYTADKDVYSRKEREYRKIPFSRWARALGVLKFDTPPTETKKISDFTAVEIPLKGNIGVPAAATVSVGDKVTRGQEIASVKDGLGVSVHASVCGTVTAVTPTKIIITR